MTKLHIVVVLSCALSALAYEIGRISVAFTYPIPLYPRYSTYGSPYGYTMNRWIWVPARSDRDTINYYPGGAEGNENEDENEGNETIPKCQESPNSRPVRMVTEPLPADTFNLARPLEPSDSVTVKGKISADGKQYTINLLSDHGGNLSVALQFKVSLDSKLVHVSHEEGGKLSSPMLLRNYFKDATWDKGDENRFSIRFRAVSDPPSTLVVEADQSYVYEFQTTLLASIRFLQVLGDVDKPLSINFEARS